MTNNGFRAMLGKLPGGTVAMVLLESVIFVMAFIAMFSNPRSGVMGVMLVILFLAGAAMMAYMAVRSIMCLARLRKNGKESLLSLDRRGLTDSAVYEFNNALRLVYPICPNGFRHNLTERANAVSDNFVFIMRENAVLTYDEVVSLRLVHWFRPGDGDNFAVDHHIYYVVTPDGRKLDLITVPCRGYTAEISAQIENTIAILHAKNPRCVIDLTVEEHRGIVAW